MKVDTADMPGFLVEADIIEALKASSIDRLDAMVGDEKMLLPPHEDMLSLGPILEAKVGMFGLFRKRSPRWKSVPMLHVHALVGAPLRVPCLKCVTNLGCEDSHKVSNCSCQHSLSPPPRRTFDGRILACRGTCCQDEGRSMRNSAQTEDRQR